MQKFIVSELIPHSQNEFFFDNMDGQKWKEFLESVRTSGVIEPPVVTNEGIIVSGHQRIRACKELGIDEIFCEVRIYDDPDKVIKDLIETNIRQRGTIAGSELKMGRVWEELKRIYGVKHGRNQFDERTSHNGESFTREGIAKKIGKSPGTLDRYAELSRLVPELQEILEEKRITATTASSLILKLPEDEQLALLKQLPSAQKLTQAQVQTYIDQMRGLERENEELRQETVEAVKVAKGAVSASEDSAEYMRMKAELEQANEDKRKYYEKWNEERKRDRGISSDDVQTEIEAAVHKTKEEYRRLIDSLQRQIDVAQDAEPEVVEVEVVPEDYEEIKAELERLKSQSTYQTDFSKQFKRMGALEEKTDEDKRADYENRLVMETGGFLSELRCFEMELDYCTTVTPVSKSLVRRNIEMIQQILIKVDDAILKGENECKSA